MTIEEKSSLEKKEFAAEFGDWLVGKVKNVGNGSWVYLNDSTEELYDIFQLIDDYIEYTERIKKALNN